jgi:hypothetical protein
VNRDAQPQIFVRGKLHAGGFLPGDVVVVQSHGMVVGLRVLAFDVPGANVVGTIGEISAPHAPAEGEVGIHLRFSPLSLELGQEAFVAYALEICEEAECGGAAGMTERFQTAPFRVERYEQSRVKLSWGQLTLATSIKVMDFNSWLTPEGQVTVSDAAG